MIVSCNGSTVTAFLTLMAQGYGPSVIRFHVKEIQKGTSFTYEILENEAGILITCTQGQGSYSVSIFMIEGVLQSVSKI